MDVVSVYIHQLETSLLGQKVCKAKDIPIYKTVAEAVKLGGTARAVDGVVIVGEHREYPITNSLVVGGAADEGAIFHCVDMLQAFVERRKGGETGVKSVQSIRGPETWKWVQRNPWAGKLLNSVVTHFDLKPEFFQQNAQANVCIVEYNDGTKAAVISGRSVGWTYAGDIEGQKQPTIVSMLGWSGPYSQYHAANGQPHWITEMMVTRKEPFNAERLLFSTGIVNHYMDSNWENGRYSAVGRRIETPFMNMKYHTTRGPMFEKRERPPHVPYIRGFDK